MKNTIIFLSFILYATFLFFISSNSLLVLVFLVNIFIMFMLKIEIIDAISNIFKFLPFVFFTLIINIFLSNYEYAILVAIKLILVCNVTFIYSKTTTVRGIATTIKNLCMPLQYLKISPDDIELLVWISLSMIPVFKREYTQLRDACLAKGMKMNIKNMKLILTKLMVSMMKRVNEMEEAIIEKGYGEV